VLVAIDSTQIFFTGFFGVCEKVSPSLVHLAVVRITNILQAAFALLFICQKITESNSKERKAAQNTFVQKNCS
jgi:hypothetical protein